MKAKIQLGELLITKGLVTKEQVNEALRIQVSGNRRLGYLLINMGLITEEQLLDVLAEQLGLPVINVDKEFTPEVKKILPRYLCRQYSVLPLQKEKNNIISLAMADPLDHEAVSNIENYTGMVVKPSLVGHKDISKAIKQYIPFSFNEFFHLLTFNRAIKFTTAFAIVLLLTTSFFLANYVYQEKYGTVSMTGDSIVYKNHDLMLGVDQSGKISLLGRAARAEGYYSVTFDRMETLKDFISQKKNNFSEKQAFWLQWVIENRIEKRKNNAHG
jgi:hypothetical protein